MWKRKQRTENKRETCPRSTDFDEVSKKGSRNKKNNNHMMKNPMINDG